MASLYVHIPFCEKKCIYCDFYSIEQKGTYGRFLASLEREIWSYKRQGEGTIFDTIFFGGGTPSLLTPDELGRLIECLKATYTVSNDVEITVETNPGTVNLQKLEGYRNIGVNRLSIGVQSLHDEDLKFLGRIHDGSTARLSMEMASAAGFKNVSIDLMYSLPGQTRERWMATLREAVGLVPAHISAYSLIVEDGTPLARMVSRGKVATLSEETEAEFYLCTMDFLRKQGFEQYEVSNYSKPGYRSRHNYNYWSHGNYLGFGPSAHSFWYTPGTIPARRWCNVSNISAYSAMIDREERPLSFEEQVTGRQLASERIFLGLRSDGVHLEAIRDEFGVDLWGYRRQFVEELLEQQHAVLDGRGRLQLTPKGYLVCDEVCERLMV